MTVDPEDRTAYHRTRDGIDYLPEGWRPYLGDHIDHRGALWRIDMIRTDRDEETLEVIGLVIECSWPIDERFPLTYAPRSVTARSTWRPGRHTGTFVTSGPNSDGEDEWPHVTLVAPSSASPSLALALRTAEARTLRDELRAWRDCICAISWVKSCPTHVPPL